VDPLAAVVVVLAAALAVAVGVAWRQRVRLDRVSRLIAAEPGQDVETASRALLEDRD